MFRVFILLVSLSVLFVFLIEGFFVHRSIPETKDEVPNYLRTMNPTANPPAPTSLRPVVAGLRRVERLRRDKLHGWNG